ncbi:MAG TPA: SRPBCC domain-containing protein [Vicinamibacterales bacterium]
MDSTVKNKPRSYEIEIDIKADIQDVWNAFAKAEELVRWFPMQATVKPGPGGSVTMGWTGAFQGVMRIDRWEPPRLLRLIDENARPYDADGSRVGESQAAPAQVVVEVLLETREGATRLRLVHSGFGQGAAWDDEIEGISTGWPFELRGLRLYLTRFRGRNRQAAYASASSPMSISDGWKRLVGKDGVTVTADKLEEGRPYSVSLPSGERFTGDIMLHIPGRELAGTARELGGGLFRICSYPAGGRSGYVLWATTYDEGRQLKELEKQCQALLDRLFPKA